MMSALAARPIPRGSAPLPVVARVAGDRQLEREGTTVKRPIGITMLAIIFAFAGISYMLLGFQMTTAVTFGPVPAGQGTWIWGWLIVLTGLAFWAGGVAAWNLQPWGWTLGISWRSSGSSRRSSRSSGRATSATPWRRPRSRSCSCGT